MFSSQERETRTRKNVEALSKQCGSDVGYTYKTVDEALGENIDKSVFRVDDINFEFCKGELLE